MVTFQKGQILVSANAASTAEEQQVKNGAAEMQLALRNCVCMGLIYGTLIYPEIISALLTWPGGVRNL